LSDSLKKPFPQSQEDNYSYPVFLISVNPSPGQIIAFGFYDIALIKPLTQFFRQFCHDAFGHKTALRLNLSRVACLAFDLPSRFAAANSVNTPGDSS
jgi:hypothetical protein